VTVQLTVEMNFQILVALIIICTASYTIWARSVFGSPVDAKEGNTHSNTVKTEKDQSTRNLWSSTTMPKVSYFASMGFPAPSDEKIWRRALYNAIEGRPVLLEQVLKVIRSPTEILSGDIRFRRIKKLVDEELCDDTGFRPLSSYRTKARYVFFLLYCDVVCKAKQRGVFQVSVRFQRLSFPPLCVKYKDSSD
jgi:hypothetical protein